jgi:hypothetical protein
MLFLILSIKNVVNIHKRSQSGLQSQDWNVKHTAASKNEIESQTLMYFNYFVKVCSIFNFVFIITCLLLKTTCGLPNVCNYSFAPVGVV